MRPRNDLIKYGLCAFVLAIVIYNTWQFIIGALALMGVWCLYNHHNHRPPGCR